MNVPNLRAGEVDLLYLAPETLMMESYPGAAK
jgi:hypothetical protein